MIPQSLRQCLAKRLQGNVSLHESVRMHVRCRYIHAQFEKHILPQSEDALTGRNMAPLPRLTNTHVSAVQNEPPLTKAH